MLLSFVVHVYSLRWMAPTFVMLGSSPCYLGIWGVWRALTALLPRRFFQRGDDAGWSFYQRLILFFFEHYTGVQLHLYGDVEEVYKRKENVLYMSNHQSTVDWIVTDMLAVRQGSMGNIRYILKSGLRFFPMYGYYFKQHGCIYVGRSGKFSQGKVEKDFQQLRTSGIPTWLVVFPEGTRYNPELPEVIRKSEAFAKEQGYKAFQHVLTPRVKATMLSIQQLRGYLDAVYDVTIAYSNTRDPVTKERLLSPGMPEFLMGASPDLHIHIRRYDMKDIPQEEGDIKNWLYQAFYEKDRLLSSFYSTDAREGEFPGHFPGKLAVTPTLPYSATFPAFLVFGSLLTTLLVTEQGRSLYWKLGLFGTIGCCLWMTVHS